MQRELAFNTFSMTAAIGLMSHMRTEKQGIVCSLKSLGIWIDDGEC